MFTIFNTVLFSFNHFILGMMALSLWNCSINLMKPNKMMQGIMSKEKKSLGGLMPILGHSIQIVGFSSLISLIPSVHGLTVSIMVNLWGALLIVLAIWLSSFTYDNNKFFSKVNVLTTSKSFSLFLACIEMVSLFIRPITLAIRLSANIIAGHVIFALIMFLPEPYLSSLSVFFYYFEIFVALIQAYIFVVLLNLYSE